MKVGKWMKKSKSRRKKASNAICIGVQSNELHKES
jgi:hypothetical protein